ncbi:MAG: hypothetical protein FJ246_10470 [Nitrospira sp.]|nr:hypothetical protein [Nitrospira sp.]
MRRSADLQGLDGWEAVRLWNTWLREGRADALDLLLRYNEADVRNLEPLATLVYDQMQTRYGPALQPPEEGRNATHGAAL